MTKEIVLQFAAVITSSFLNNSLNTSTYIDGNYELPIIRRSSDYDFDKVISHHYMSPIM